MEKFAPSRTLCEKTQRICGGRSSYCEEMVGLYMFKQMLLMCCITLGVKPLDIVYRGLEK